jgi:glyoxylase-like metal-dependent hydrolase (beta-lactamase superfamily II)
MEFGNYRIEVIPDTEFRLDGGAMFGVVPRVLWERVCPPDELNRVALTCNCLFIDTGEKKVLIETGIGEKWTPRETEIYGINRKQSFADSLKSVAGCGVDEMDLVVNTHLHFDHAGGNTVHGHSGTPIPQFPNARYLVSRAEFEAANSPHERDRASYLSENWKPLIDEGQVDLMPDIYEPVPGLVIEQVRGHSETMQTIQLTCEGQILYGFFDLIPTRHHLSPAWIMSYDLFPTETLGFKNGILPRAIEENWICHFYHDIEIPLGRLVENEGKINAIAITAHH